MGCREVREHLPEKVHPKALMYLARKNSRVQSLGRRTWLPGVAQREVVWLDYGASVRRTGLT
jgi:hypothetical protein